MIAPARFRRSPNLLPLALLAAVFALSRTAAYAAGVRFDASPLDTFWQIADPRLLRHDLLETLWYLHGQPPLYNLFLGLVLKLSSGSYAAVLHITYIACGLVSVVALYLLLAWLGLRRAVAGAVAAVVAVSPAMILYENWLYYEFPVMAMLLLAALALLAFLRSGSLPAGIAFFGLLAALVYTRSSFQIVWFLLAFALLVPAVRDRRRLLAAAALPLALVVGLYVKNAAAFGVFGTSSWTGMNIAQVALDTLTPEQKVAWNEQGRISRVALVPVFSDLTRYDGLVPRPKRTGVPVLDERWKTDAANLENLQYVEISRRYLHDALAIIRAQPFPYLEKAARGMRNFMLPSSDYLFVRRNSRELGAYGRVFDNVVYVRAPFLFHGIGVTIIAAYLIAWLYGLVLLARRARWTPERATLLFLWLTISVVAVETALTQVGEHQRLRFPLDPVAAAIVAVALAAAWRAVRAPVRLPARLPAAE